MRTLYRPDWLPHFRSSFYLCVQSFMGWVLRSVFPWVSFHFCSTVSLRFIFMSLRVRRVFFYSIFVFINSFPSGFLSVSKWFQYPSWNLFPCHRWLPSWFPQRNQLGKPCRYMYLSSGKQSICLIIRVVAGLHSAHYWPAPAWQQNSVPECCASRSACSL